MLCATTTSVSPSTSSHHHAHHPAKTAKTVSLLPAFRQDSTRAPGWSRSGKWQMDESM